MSTVTVLLAQAREMGVDRLDAQIILARRLGADRTWILAHGDATIDPDLTRACLQALELRSSGVPLAYLVGQREFHGVTLTVTPAVLDPRPDTETLVDWALELIDHRSMHVVDLGTGSGAIALAVKRARPHVDMAATDIRDDALAVARASADRLGLSVRFLQGDWWSAVPGERFDLALSNPPYVARSDPHLTALRHEPLHALTPGPTGLEAIERIVEGAGAHLHDGAWLLLEHGHDQAEAVCECLLRHRFEAPETRVDLGGVPRCTGARRAA